MSRSALTYIWSVLLAALFVTLSAVPTRMPPAEQWAAFVVLTMLATLAQLFVAEGPNHVAFFVSPIFVFAGVLMLEPVLFAGLVLTYQLVEWVKERLADSHRLRHWYIQPFNISVDLLAGAAARWSYASLTEQTSGLHGVVPVIVGASAACAFVVANHALLGLALVLARGKRWHETGMLTAGNVLSDLVLLLLGYIVAVLWQINPWLILPALSPLALMYRALMVPALQQEAQTDAKTGLLNARYVVKRCEDELARAERTGRPVVLAMADLDYLRTINNTYGHLAGDVVIEGIGRIIAASVRPDDIAGRFGGEEFVIAMSDTTRDRAIETIEHIRAQIEATEFEIESSTQPIRVTMSFGVACYPADATNLTQLVEAADSAVYRAKAEGRNCVRVSPGLSALAIPA